MSGFRDRHAEFEAAGAQVLGLSADPSPSLRVFHEQLGLQFPLISDYRDLEMITKFGIFNPRFRTPFRRTYVIDKKGIIRKIVVDDKDMQAHSIVSLEVAKQLAAEG